MEGGVGGLNRGRWEEKGRGGGGGGGRMSVDDGWKRRGGREDCFSIIGIQDH